MRSISSLVDPSCPWCIDFITSVAVPNFVSNLVNAGITTKNIAIFSPAIRGTRYGINAMKISMFNHGLDSIVWRYR